MGGIYLFFFQDEIRDKHHGENSNNKKSIKSLLGEQTDEQNRINRSFFTVKLSGALTEGLSERAVAIETILCQNEGPNINLVAGTIRFTSTT